MSSLWVFFLPLDHIWTIALVFLSILTWLLSFSDHKKSLLALFHKSTKWRVERWVVYIICLLFVSYSSSLPAYVIDNESYYIQTIKWLDQYGLVYGLGNLHVFYAQTSGFHILESALNLGSFFSFNDLSGYFFLIGLLWSLNNDIDEQDKILWYYRKSYTVLGLICFTFSSAPSPDIPVYVLSYLLIYYFLKLWKQWSSGNFVYVALLSVQIIFFKVTSVLIFLLIIALWFKYRKIKLPYGWIPIAAIFGVIFFAKNIVLTGMPLYPISSWAPIYFDWTIPQELVHFYSKSTAGQAYGVNFIELDQLSWLEKFKRWIMHTGLEGWLNKVVILIAGISLIAFFKMKSKKMKILLLIFFLQCSVLFITSPQFRFFLNLLIPVSVMIVVSMFNWNKRLWITLSYTLVFLGFGLAAVIPLQNSITDNKLMKKEYTITAKILWNPFPKSIYPDEYESTVYNETTIYTPVSDAFYYGVYDLPLPASSSLYLNYMKSVYGISPQARTKHLKDGFRTVRLKD